MSSAKCLFLASAAAAAFCSVGPLAAREAKALVRRYRGPPESWPTMADLARTIARLRATPEAREGLTAFLEKRDPAWKASRS